MNKNVICIIPSPCSKRTLVNLETCIDSIIAASGKANISHHIVIVTNGKNISLGKISRKINNIIKYKGKFNFAEMNNLAVKESIHKNNKSSWFLFINDDAWIREDMLINFFKIIKHKKADIYNTLVKKSDGGGIDSFGIEYFKSGLARNAENLSTKTSLATASVLFVSGNFVRKIIKEYGYLFNPILESYVEDVDLSIRALGIGGIISKSRKLVSFHIGSFINKSRSRYVLKQSFRNTLWVILLDWPLEDIVRNILSILIVQIWFFIYATRRFGLEFYKEIFNETRLKLPEILKERKKIQSRYSRNITLKYYMSKYTFKTSKGYVF